jgi:uncharacterized protein
MHTVDRRGVAIEQCESCRGIFLDRGELEQLASAEQGYYAAAPPPYREDPRAYPGPRQAPGYDPRYQGGGHYRDSPPPYRGDSPPPYRDSPQPYGHRGHKRRRGFLEELFD